MSIVFTKNRSVGFDPRVWRTISAGTTVNNGSFNLLRTNGAAYTVTLPALVTVGAIIHFKDADDNAAIVNITLGRNGNTIEGRAEDLIVNLNATSFALQYLNGSWRVIQ